MEKKIKVVWICHLSNDLIRSHLAFSNIYYLNILSSLIHKPITRWSDFAIWNTNAIREFEQFKDIDLTVIFPYAGIKGRKQKFKVNGVHYIAFRSEDDHLIPFVKERFLELPETNYKKNRALILSLIQEIQPDIVHIIGAENPYYSAAALDVPNYIPSIISLQTLMSSPDYFMSYPISCNKYKERTKIEQQIIKKCNYVASRVEKFKRYIWDNIDPEAVFLQMPLALGQNIIKREVKKEYDFVYFAANIDKACDYAIEAFALACEVHPNLTLNVSGSYSTDYKSKLDYRLKELGLQNQVYFTGLQATHEDVLTQINKSKYALLPLKVDLISGTIREAMACGLPVVSTITPSTPKLNEVRESILLSENGDFQAMADNMLRLINDEQYAARIRDNAVLTMRERYSNERFMQMWRKAYYEILDNFKKGTGFSDAVISK